MLGQFTLLVSTAILASFALDPLDDGNIGEQGNVNGDPTADVVSALDRLPLPPFVRFRNRHLKTCIRLSHAEGLKLERCNRNSPQLWDLHNLQFINTNNGKCMGIKEDGTVFVAKCGDSDRQKWAADIQLGFKGELFNLGQEKCVDLPGTFGVVGQICSGTIDQQWERIG